MADWDSESDEENEKGETSWGGYAATIFLIEATKCMFDQDENDESYFGKCIECCKEQVLNQIRSNKKGPMAIVLFGTEKGTDSFNNVCVLQDLSTPSADQVKHLIKMLESDGFDEFDSKFGSSKDFSVANVLWFCHRLLSASKMKLTTKHIIMMTCTPHPHANDPVQQRQAKERAISLNDGSILLNVIPLGSQFDKEAFYAELTQIANGQDQSEDVGIEDPSENVDEIVRHVNQCSSQKRSTGRIPWHLGKGVKLSVSVCNLVQPKSMPSKKRLYRRTNDEVRSKPQLFDAVSGEVVHTAKQNKYVEMGGRKVTFEKVEWQQTKQVVGSGITLLGFKPKSCVKHFLQKGAFLYPDEKLIRGSRTLFAALHQRCLARDVVAICYFTPRKVSVPKLVAVCPQQEELDSKGFQVVPAGFYVVYLPFAGNIRDVSKFSVEFGPPEADLKEIARNIINKINYDYDPYLIRNPKLRVHWANIEAIALGLEERENVRDETAPNHEMMGKVLGDLSQQFMDLAFGDDYDPMAVLKPSRSRKATSDSERAAKKPRLDLESSSIKDIAEAGQIDKLKVDELKQYLRTEGVSITGKKKADLVTAVYEHLGIDQF